MAKTQTQTQPTEAKVKKAPPKKGEAALKAQARRTKARKQMRERLTRPVEDLSEMDRATGLLADRQMMPDSLVLGPAANAFHREIVRTLVTSNPGMRINKEAANVLVNYVFRQVTQALSDASVLQRFRGRKMLTDEELTAVLTLNKRLRQRTHRGGVPMRVMEAAGRRKKDAEDDEE